VIIPAADESPTLGRALTAAKAAVQPPDEILVVDEPRGATATVARNIGANRAAGDLLVFVDADVEVHPDALARMREAFELDPALVAIFGSYDDAPEGGVVSGFRNLLHHYVHQDSGGEIATFWAGLGAMRRDAFLRAGGFVEHPVEDIELGMRLSAEGAKIVLDPRIQGKHLKNWNLWSMIRTDFVVRGVPWVGLMMRHRSAAATLNVGWRHRLSALACIALVVALPFGQLLPAAVALGAVLVLNARFYALLLRRRGPLQAAVGVVLHVIHQLVAVAALPFGLLAYARDQHGVRASARIA
jgi:glycosyltransferase involved in cell wall biosynthesis